MGGMATPSRIYWNERMWAPWWWHVALVTLVALLGSELAQTFNRPVLQVLSYLVLLGFGELLLWRSGRCRVRIDDEFLEVGNWRLELARVTSAEPLTGPGAASALHASDDGEYRQVRTWLKSMVRLEVDDPDDKPTWLFCSRRPAELVGALVAARAAAVPGGAAEALRPELSQEPG
jgi:hypothetical protein